MISCEIMTTFFECYNKNILNFTISSTHHDHVYEKKM